MFLHGFSTCEDSYRFQHKSLSSGSSALVVVNTTAFKDTLLSIFNAPEQYLHSRRVKVTSSVVAVVSPSFIGVFVLLAQGSNTLGALPGQMNHMREEGRNAKLAARC